MQVPAVSQFTIVIRPTKFCPSGDRSSGVLGFVLHCSFLFFPGGKSGRYANRFRLIVPGGHGVRTVRATRARRRFDPSVDRRVRSKTRTDGHGHYLLALRWRLIISVFVSNKLLCVIFFFFFIYKFYPDGQGLWRIMWLWWKYRCKQPTVVRNVVGGHIGEFSPVRHPGVRHLVQTRDSGRRFLYGDRGRVVSTGADVTLLSLYIMFTCSFLASKPSA